MEIIGSLADTYNTVNTCKLHNNEIYHVINILLGCLTIAIFILFLYWHKRVMKSNVALSKMFLLKYAKTLNNESNSYINIFLTNLRTNKVYVLKGDNYEEVDGGVSRVLKSIHPDDRDTYMRQRSEFLKGKISTVMIYLRMFDESSKKYNLNDVVFNVLKKDILGRVVKYHVIVLNETLQNEVTKKKYKDLHDLNMAVQSARLIRWDIDLTTNINRIVNIDNNEYLYTNRQLIKRIAPDNYKQLRSLIGQIKQDKSVDSITIEIDLFGDGVCKSYEVMAKMVCNDDGSPLHIYGILKDVSKLLLYQGLLSREVDINRIIWNSVNAGIYFYDHTGLCKRVNDKVLNYPGFTEDKLVDNLNLFKINAISEESKDILRNGESISYQTTYANIINAICNDCIIVDDKNNELLSVNCSPVFGNDKEIIGYVSVDTDITDITRSRKNIEELHAKISLALDAGDLLVWTYDFNDNTYTLLGYNQLYSTSKTIDKFVGVIFEEDRNIITDAHEAIRTGKSQKETYVVRGKLDGKLTIYRSTIISQQSERGEVYIIGVSKDISAEIIVKSDLADANTMLDKKNQELNLTNQLLEGIIERMPGLLFIKDIDDGLKYYIVNSQFCDKMSVESSDKIIGYSDYDIFPKELADLFYKGDMRSIERNESVEMDEDVTINGFTRTWKTIKTPITLANNKKMLVCLSLDVTDLYILKNQAQHSDALKSQFLANVSHELRTPLNAIVGFSDLLIGTDDYETKKEFNEIITTNSDLLLNLINDILDLSKIESGVISFDDDYFSINEILDDTYLIFNMRTNPNVTLRCVKFDKNWHVEIDNKRFRQILNNFLSNAVKYTPSGEIIFGCELERDGLRLFVKDTGIGITDENKSKVFNRFEKLDTFAQGTGLGLSICKALIDLKGGEIGFESTFGEGSYFWIWIPCKHKIII